MPRIANPISPIAQAFDTIGKVLISMPTVEERAMRESQAALMQAQRENAIIEANLGRRKAGAIDGIADVFARSQRGVPMTDDRPDPGFVGPMPSARPTMSADDWSRSLIGDLVKNAAAINPAGVNNLGGLLRTFLANSPGVSPGVISNAMLGAGDSMQSTPVGFEQAQAQDMKKHGMSLGNQRAIAEMTTNRQIAAQQAALEKQMQAQEAQLGREFVNVLGPNGQVIGMPKSEYLASAKMVAPDPAPGQDPLAPRPDPMTRPALATNKAAGAQPFSYRSPNGQIGMTVDGLTDIQTGRPLLPGTIRISAGTQDTIEGLSRPQAAEAMKLDLGIDRFSNTLDTIVQLGQDPTNVGTAGAVRSLLQNSLASLDSVAAIFGTNPGAVRNMIASSGASTDFRTTIPQLDTMAQLAAYQAAEALAQQSGKGLSDNDVKRFRAMLGDPTSWLSNQSEFFARVQALKQQVAFEVEQARKFRAGMAGRGAASAPGGVVPNAGAPAAAAPTQNTPAPPAGFRIVQ